VVTVGGGEGKQTNGHVVAGKSEIDPAGRGGRVRKAGRTLKLRRLKKTLLGLRGGGGAELQMKA